MAFSIFSGGGDKKIFDDKEYLKQIDHPIPISPQTQVKTSNLSLRTVIFIEQWL